MYADDLPGHLAEFVAYRILYAVYTGVSTGVSWGPFFHISLTICAYLDMLRTLQELSPQLKQQPVIQHALNVQKAYTERRFSSFFKLYAAAPNMGRSLMGLLAPTVRMYGLKVICKSYAPLPDIADTVLIDVQVPAVRAARLCAAAARAGRSRPVRHVPAGTRRRGDGGRCVRYGPRGDHKGGRGAGGTAGGGDREKEIRARCRHPSHGLNRNQ